MKGHFQISPDLLLPLEAVTQTFAILAKRGMGKTYTANVMVEEMLKANQQVIVADPVGVWYGLRSSADGKSPGFPIVVFGGEKADVPLDASAGETIAKAIIEGKFSAVLDLSLLRKGASIQFMTDFAETLYRLNRSPLHLVLDEADAFAPQKPQPGEMRMLGAMEDIVRRGRARGLGVTLITQRAACINKNVLTQIEVLVALRMISPQDREALLSWVDAHGTEQEKKLLVESLPSLPVGEAWFWSPGWLDIFKRVKIRTRETFDSSSTPKVGQVKAQPKAVAKVDIEQLRGQISELAQQAKENDPAYLKSELAKLRKQIETLEKRPAEVKTVEVPVVSPELRESFMTRAAELMKEMTQTSAVVSDLTKAILESAKHQQPITLPARLAPDSWAGKPHGGPRITFRPATPTASAEQGSNLPKAERRILTCLAQYSEGCTKRKTALIAGYAVGGGGFNNAISSLRSKGYVEGSDPLCITQDGVNALGNYSPLPTGQLLLQHWLGQLPKCEVEILTALWSVGQPLTKEEIASRTESQYQANGGGFNNAISKLRTLELIQDIQSGGERKIKISDELLG